MQGASATQCSVQAQPEARGSRALGQDGRCETRSPRQLQEGVPALSPDVCPWLCHFLTGSPWEGCLGLCASVSSSANKVPTMMIMAGLRQLCPEERLAWDVCSVKGGVT